MDSADRSISIVVGFVSAAFVAIIFLVSSCTIREAQINQPQTMLQTRSEHSIKMACIAARGEYDGYNRCTFVKK